MSSSATPGTGINNTFAPTTASCGADYVEIVLDSRVWNTYWGGAGVASDNTWATN